MDIPPARYIATGQDGRFAVLLDGTIWESEGTSVPLPGPVPDDGGVIASAQIPGPLLGLPSFTHVFASSEECGVLCGLRGDGAICWMSTSDTARGASPCPSWGGGSHVFQGEWQDLPGVTQVATSYEGNDFVHCFGSACRYPEFGGAYATQVVELAATSGRFRVLPRTGPGPAGSRFLLLNRAVSSHIIEK